MNTAPVELDRREIDLTIEDAFRHVALMNNVRRRFRGETWETALYRAIGKTVDYQVIRTVVEQAITSALALQLRQPQTANQDHRPAASTCDIQDTEGVMFAFARALDDRDNPSAAEWLRENADRDDLWSPVGSLLDQFEDMAEHEQSLDL
ncbi:MAG TPA: hypothetical protein VFU07_05455 [Candidatus Lumbricidophila sp.]|nr:hypothetical protein [Candidatus Lumbricidophila sp.]